MVGFEVCTLTVGHVLVQCFFLPHSRIAAGLALENRGSSEVVVLCILYYTAFRRNPVASIDAYDPCLSPK